VLDVQHQTVNHSQHFVNPDDGTHTNTIEGTWNGMKMNIPSRKRCREGIEDHLLEFIWRRKNKNNLWGGFIVKGGVRLLQLGFGQKKELFSFIEGLDEYIGKKVFQLGEQRDF